jgi:hypothetical protein
MRKITITREVSEHELDSLHDAVYEATGRLKWTKSSNQGTKMSDYTITIRPMAISL